MTTAPSALEQFIRGIPLFELVGPEDMHEVLRVLRPVQLTAGDVLFREGEPGRAMWVLGEGAEVSISTTQGSKRPVAVAYARKGDVLGEMALVDDGSRSATAVVTQDGTAHEIDAQEFHAMRSTFVPAAFKVLRKISMDLCRRLRATNERIVPSGKQVVKTPPLPPGRRPEVKELDAFPAFKALPAVVKLALAQKLDVYEFHELTPLFAEGEPNDGAYFLVEGEVSVGRNGKTLANLPPGTMFGVVACIDNGLRSASCLTTGPARLFRMSERHFDTLFASGHRFAYQMVDLVARQLVSHVREANQMLPLPGRPSGPARSARPVEQMLPTAPERSDLELVEAPELEIESALPLELELDLGDFESEGVLLGQGGG
ncbi:MAG: cyclic nucleotide-binding domain-containing protein [Myxococcus sp.]|nr:cyclic nucleotide-binding domain-containing protein [Myxococcus sp.]